MNRLTLGLFFIASFAGSLVASVTETLMLSGTGPDDAVEWDFLCTAGRNSRVWSKIRVPSCWELQGFGTYNYGGSMQHNTGDIVGNEQGLYRRTFTVPAAWQGRVVRLVFDGSMTDTSVWVNGQSAGPTHQGSFYNFHYDITALIRLGEENLIEITVAKNSSNRSVNDAERASDYWTFGGIFRPVWLEALPPQFIDWTAIDARADGSFSAEIHFGNPAVPGEVRAEVMDLDGRPVGAVLTTATTTGESKAIVRATISGVKAWTAETPHLYHVRFTVKSGGTEHSVTERFGFRTIEVRENDGVYLNGTKITLKGVNRHCFWPETGRTVSREQSFADARLIKAGNMNAVRMSHYPPDRHFLEACDEIGLYVLDELGGWQKPYDIATGARLIGELVRRDVNHPCIVFWDNGNEGGWKAENDGEFAQWDPQKRAVLHPWAINSGINTDHYEQYDSTVKLSAGPQIFMPTEFLHGLWDGGIGAGFRDYWDVMGRSPTVAGGFFWVWSDEGVVRTDQNGRIDNAGNQAPDGIVGPHREIEGSYMAVKEIWSPVQIRNLRAASSGLTAVVEVENQFDFTDLSECTFEWRLTNLFVGENEPKVVATGVIQSPKLAPRARGEMLLDLSSAAGHRVSDDMFDTSKPRHGNERWRFAAAALEVVGRYPGGREMWTWSWPLWEGRAMGIGASGDDPLTIDDSGDSSEFVVRYNVHTFHYGEAEYRFDKASGRLTSVRFGPRSAIVSSARGPRFVAYHGEGRGFEAMPVESRLLQISARKDGNVGVVEAAFDGPLRKIRWTIGNELQLDWEYAFTGEVDLLGVCFDYPEANVRAKRWVGRGPYRVYRNRMEGGIYGLHELAYNDPIPGESFTYPEFKGYFRDWQELQLETTEGRMVIQNAGLVPFLGLYAPRDGVPSLQAFPDTGIAFLEVIPAIGSKFAGPETTGPQGRTPHVAGERSGSIVFRFEPAAK